MADYSWAKDVKFCMQSPLQTKEQEERKSGLFLRLFWSFFLLKNAWWGGGGWEGWEGGNGQNLFNAAVFNYSKAQLQSDFFVSYYCALIIHGGPEINPQIHLIRYI